MIDYIAISGTKERNVLGEPVFCNSGVAGMAEFPAEYVNHLHEHFVYPCSINENGHYNVPTHEKEGYRYVMSKAEIFSVNANRADSIQMHESSIAKYRYPDGSYWVGIRETCK